MLFLLDFSGTTKRKVPLSGYRIKALDSEDAAIPHQILYSSDSTFEERLQILSTDPERHTDDGGCQPLHPRP